MAGRQISKRLHNPIHTEQIFRSSTQLSVQECADTEGGGPQGAVRAGGGDREVKSGGGQFKKKFVDRSIIIKFVKFVTNRVHHQKDAQITAN